MQRDQKDHSQSLKRQSYTEGAWFKICVIMITFYVIFLLLKDILADQTEIRGVQNNNVPNPISSLTSQNIDCVFHDNQLRCDIKAYNVDVGNYTCSVCPHFRTKGQDFMDTCPKSYDESRCPTTRGRCVYDCRTLGFCRESLLIKVTWMEKMGYRENISICKLVTVKHYKQPDPVRDLKLTRVNGTHVKVTWRKPADKSRRKVVYKYVIYCSHDSAPIYTKSAKDHLARFCRYSESGMTVTVKSRRHRSGSWSLPQTVSSSNKKGFQKQVVPSSSKHGERIPEEKTQNVEISTPVSLIQKRKTRYSTDNRVDRSSIRKHEKKDTLSGDLNEKDVISHTRHVPDDVASRQSDKNKAFRVTSSCVPDQSQWRMIVIATVILITIIIGLSCVAMFLCMYFGHKMRRKTLVHYIPIQQERGGKLSTCVQDH